MTRHGKPTRFPYPFDRSTKERAAQRPVAEHQVPPRPSARSERARAGLIQGPTRYRKPSRLTFAVTGSTIVFAAAAAASLAAVAPASASSQPPTRHDRATRHTAQDQRWPQLAALTSAASTPTEFSWELMAIRTTALHGHREAVAAARRAAARARAARAAARAAAARVAAARAAADAATAQASAAPTASPAPAPAPVSSGSPQQIAASMLASFGWSQDQFSCLEPLWNEESGWNVYAANASGAYGIPQALPGSKMASAGPDWQSDAETQIRWGLEYIQSTYGSPCSAWAHEQADGWY